MLVPELGRPRSPQSRTLSKSRDRSGALSSAGQQGQYHRYYSVLVVVVLVRVLNLELVPGQQHEYVEDREPSLMDGTAYRMGADQGTPLPGFMTFGQFRKLGGFGPGVDDQ
jgi:hypothetical protein